MGQTHVTNSEPGKQRIKRPYSFLALENQFIDPIFADRLPEFREDKNGISTSSGRGLILKGLQRVGHGGEPVNSAESRVHAFAAQPLAHR